MARPLWRGDSCWQRSRRQQLACCDEVRESHRRPERRPAPPTGR